MSGEIVIDDAAGCFHEVEAGRPVRFHAHVVYDYGDDVGLVSLQREGGWEVECLVVASCRGVANPGADICLIDPD